MEPHVQIGYGNRSKKQSPEDNVIQQWYATLQDALTPAILHVGDVCWCHVCIRLLFCSLSVSDALGDHIIEV